MLFYDALTGTFKVAANTASAADKAKDVVEEYGPYATMATLGPQILLGWPRFMTKNVTDNVSSEPRPG